MGLYCAATYPPPPKNITAPIVYVAIITPLALPDFVLGVLIETAMLPKDLATEPEAEKPGTSCEQMYSHMKEPKESPPPPLPSPTPSS